DAGTPVRSALAIMTRNSRMPEALAADLDAECSACLMGARRLGELFDRHGKHAVESAFDAIIDNSTKTYRREILSKIPVGSWVWEDYAEHDGVDEPKLHRQRITLTRTAEDDPGGERLIIDFAGTSPQAKGPINHCADYSDGVFMKKWLAPILRNLADTPQRMGELDVNEGIVPLIEMRFPPQGTLLTPVFPAPTNARTFVSLRMLGVLAGGIAKAVDGKMPASPEKTSTATATSCGKCSAGQPAAGATPMAKRRSMSAPIPGTFQLNSPSHGSCSSWRSSSSQPIPAVRASSVAGWDTKNTCGCSKMPTSCRSRTARSSPAGASMAARPLPRSG